MKTANLVLRFVLELLMLVALGVWGWEVGAGPTAQIVFAIGAPLFVCVYWGLFVSPKAVVKAPHSARMLLGLLAFAAATAALYGTGRVVLAIAYGATALVSTTLMILWRQDESRRAPKSGSSPARPAR